MNVCAKLFLSKGLLLADVSVNHVQPAYLKHQSVLQRKRRRRYLFSVSFFIKKTFLLEITKDYCYVLLYFPVFYDQTGLFVLYKKFESLLWRGVIREEKWQSLICKKY